jgi:hypothetical protein
MCTTRSRTSSSLKARLGNPSVICFQVKQAARSRRMSHIILPLSVLYCNQQTVIHLVLRLKPINRHEDFKAQITKPELSVLRPKPGNHKPLVLRLNWEKSSQWFWGQTTDKLLTLILRLNQEICDPHLHVHGVDRTQCHPIARPPST